MKSKNIADEINPKDQEETNIQEQIELLAEIIIEHLIKELNETE